MWNKVAKGALTAGKYYLEHRGLDGALEDVKKLTDWGKRNINSMLPTSGQRTARYERPDFSDEQKLTETDSSEYETLAEDVISEMQSNFNEAKKFDINSPEFHDNASFAIEIGYNFMNRAEEEEDDCLDEYLTEIDGLCDEIIEYIVDNCKGSINIPEGIVLGSHTNNFGMKVYRAYPVNLPDASTMLVGVCVNGTIHADESLDLSEYDDEINPIVSYIGMFGKKIDMADSGDLCVIFLDEECAEYLPNDEFFIGEEPTEDTCNIKDEDISDSENEYLEELKTCYEDGIITDKERRLLDRLRKSLGISEARAAELEAMCQHQSLTAEEREYADEIRACLEDDGVITAKERRLLDRLTKSLSISPGRAAEIEKMMK